MNNNPISNIDPDGDLPFLAVVGIGAATGLFGNGLSNISQGNNFFDGAGKAALWGGIGAAAGYGIGAAFGGTGSFGHEALRGGAHAFSSGLQSELQGGSFWQGALSGGISSGIGSGIDALGGNASTQIGGAGLGGGIGSAISGGNFFQGMTQGLLVGGFNHALHSGINGLYSDCPKCPPGKKPGDIVFKSEGGLLNSKTVAYVVNEDGSLSPSSMQVIGGSPLIAPGGGPFKAVKYLRVPKGEL